MASEAGNSVMDPCFGTAEGEAVRQCALPAECDETNRCLVELLRERGWTVVCPSSEGKDEANE